MTNPIHFTTAEEAVKVIKSGDHVHLSSVASAPQCLINAMCKRGEAGELKDVHVHHLHTEGPAPYADPKFEGVFQLDSFFVGANVRKVTQSGYADYIPIFLSETQRLYRCGAVPCNVAMIQVCPPDKHGFVSLGTSVDATLAAVECADYVIAVVNKYVPRAFGQAMIHSSKIDFFVQDDTPNFQKAFGKHNVSVLIGYNYEDNTNSNLSMSNYDFPTDAYSYNKMEAGMALKRGEASMTSYKNSDKLIGLFTRVSYNFNDRYLLMASLRHEGSSKFGKDHKWGNFPGISLGWRINRENFMKNVNWMDNLKLRVGYGVTGINVADPYTSLSSLNYNGAFLYNGTWVKALETIRNNNADLRWEKKHEFNVGLDWDVLGGRLGGTVDYYIRRTKDALWDYEVPVPPYMYPTMLANASEMENKGLEILIRATPIQTEKFTWNTNVSYSTNSNKVVALSSEKFSMDQDYFYTGYTGEPIQTTTHIVQVGKPIGTFYGLKSVDITDDGLWLVENKKGEHVLAEETDATDWQVLGNGIPKHYLNWNNTFNFFNFDLSINMRGAFGFQILNYQRMYYENAKPEIQYNRLNSAFDKVYGKTQLKDDQRYVSYYVEDGDYWKIDNVTLGYTFKLSKQHIIKNLRIYASVLNLATITGYKGMDPEVPLSSNTYGLLDAGTDNRDKYPTNRTYTFGVNLTF